MNKHVFVFIISFLLTAVALKAQNCSIQASSTKVCLGGTVSFMANSNTNDTAWLWNFGNGNTSTQKNPTYQFPNSGTYTISLTTFRQGGLSCQAQSIQVRVFDKPTASYTVNGGRYQCFEGNNFVFNDLSKPGLSNAPIIKRVVIFDDGDILQENAPFANTFSHSFPLDNQKYRVVIEVTDSNNCLNQYIDSVFTYPKVLPLQLQGTQQVECNSTKAVFQNLSNYDSTNAKSIKWVVDENDTLTSPWKTLTYTYTGNKTFRPKLIIEDKNGCIITATLPFDIISFIPDSNIHINGSNKSCYKNNRFIFSNSTRVGNLIWTVKDANGKNIDMSTGSTSTQEFITCGRYDITLQYIHNNCRFVKDTQVHVYGPKTAIDNDTLAPINWIQCGSKDSVIFNKPDINCKYQNANLVYIWDFNDPFAPPCTTDTRRGLNMGINCNFSNDTVNVKHFYSQPFANCYKPSLFIKDTVLGCEDIDSVDLRLHPPKAGWDSTVNPPLPRVYVKQTGCSRVVNFFLERLLPTCGPEEVWLLPDSGCVGSGWIKIDSVGYNQKYTHTYSKLCDSITGKITFGIVVLNGKNQSGKTCYDTTWYHHQLNMPTRIPFTALLIDNEICKPFNVKVTPKDSIYKDLTDIFWDFGDGSPLVRQVFSDDDSIVKPQFHTYEKDGVYGINLGVNTKNGCYTISSESVSLGKSAIFHNFKSAICLGTESILQTDIFYNTDPNTKYWNDTNRFLAGKEQLHWNYGDSDKWIPAGTTTRHTYANAGQYQIKVAYKDSSTSPVCFDTLTFPLLHVYTTVAKIYLPTDTFYCAPTIVSFIDSSYSMQDTLFKQYNISKREWVFTPAKPFTSMPVVNVFFEENGTFPTKLMVESPHGCKAETVVNFTIIGPQPNFVIHGDTFGCAPFKVTLRNETHKQLKNWIWNFNDSAGSFLSTNNDSDVTFTYHQPGIYPIDLTGEEDVFNPTTGSFKNCTAKFPFTDASNPFHIRQILVLASDTLEIITNHDTICANQELEASVKDSFYVSTVEWVWGDTSNNTIRHIKETAVHSYANAGKYLLKLEPVITNKAQCVTGNQKEITVLKPLADFDFEVAAYPTFNFTNKSKDAVRYYWDFGQPEATVNSSTQENPTHTFIINNKEMVVCLSAFDINDCMDSVCKPLPLRARVEIPNVFTPGNKDGKNDAFDIDIEGWTQYDLYIYNRWGNLVFEGHEDGFKNDGINWDGKNKNDGSDCAEGVYFVIFKYKLITSAQEEVYHGTVTLIRD